MTSLPPFHALGWSVSSTAAPADRLVYYSKSKDAKPGQGANERLGATTPGDAYEELGAIRGWRKVLSQFHPEVFEYDGHSFTTAEHAWHYVKLKMIGHPNKARLFARESGSALAMGSALDAKRAGGKRGVHSMSADEVARWELEKRRAVEDMLYAKFSSSALARRVLLATGDAELLHYERGPKLVDLLSAVRARVRAETSPPAPQCE